MKLRLKRGQREPLARQISEEVVRIAAGGSDLDWQAGCQLECVDTGREVEVDRLVMSHSRLCHHELIDIWVRGHGKVFSVRRQPFEIVRFRFGDWVDELLPGVSDFQPTPSPNRT